MHGAANDRPELTIAKLTPYIGAEVLGVLIARASDRPLDVFLRDRLFEPLGMVDTGFWTSELDRLGTCYAPSPNGGEPVVYDAPDGQWAKPPVFPSGGGGLVSTLDDLHAFARMLLDRGRLRKQLASPLAHLRVGVLDGGR